MSKHLATALALLTLAYPLVVYLSLDRLEPRWIALALVAVAIARAWATRRPIWLATAAGAGVLGLVAGLGNAWGPLKLYPVLVNAVLLAVFAYSLVRGPTVVERLARLTQPQLPAAAVAYTRTVTKVWCGFFVVNGAMAVVTTFWMSDAAWALYNGLLSYLLMGALLGGEWLVRRRVQAHAAHG